MRVAKPTDLTNVADKPYNAVNVRDSVRDVIAPEGQESMRDKMLLGDKLKTLEKLAELGGEDRILSQQASHGFTQPCLPTSPELFSSRVSRFSLAP